MLLVQLAAALEAEQNRFAQLLTREQGKPLADAFREVAYAVTTLRYFATLDLPTETLHTDTTRTVVRQRKPLGVVAAITPWNLPVLLLVIEVAPALLAGNTVVAKPAPTTPLTTLRFGEIWEIVPGCSAPVPVGAISKGNGKRHDPTHRAERPPVVAGAVSPGRPIRR